MAYKKNDIPESKSFTTIKVVRDEDLYRQIGKDIYFDLVDHDKVHSFRVHNSTPFKHFKELVAEQFGVQLQLQRFWWWVKRMNGTYRPHRPMAHVEETQHVYQLKKVETKDGKWALILFLEVLETVPRPHKTEEDILLFFKLYEPEKEEIRYVGKFFVKGSGSPPEILKMLIDMVHFAPNEEIELFEEIKFVPKVMCELINKERTFLANQLENGDIICFQKAHPVQKNFRYPDIPSFLGFIRENEAKLNVSSVKRKLKEVEENMTPLQLKLISIKNELKETEENMATLQLKAIAIKGELNEAEENMASLRLKEATLKEKLKEAEKNVAVLEAMNDLVTVTNGMS